MSKENVEDPPKIIEPPQNQEKPTRTPSKKVSEASSIVPKKDGKPQNKHLKEKILLFAGIPATILVAIFLQYIYHNYFIIPLEERTLYNVVNIDSTQLPWIARTNGSTFSLFHKSGLSLQITYGTSDDGPNFVWIKGDNKFGEVSISDSSVVVRYLFTDTDFDLSISLAKEVHVKKHLEITTNGKLSYMNATVILSDFKISGLELHNEGFKTLSLQPGDDIFISGTASEKKNSSFIEKYQSVETEYETAFDKVFQLKTKTLPEFYQNMGKAALSLVLSSLYTEKRIFEATGEYNSWFKTQSLPFTHMHLPYGCEDLKTQGLAALSIVDLHPRGVLQIINCWTNLVNNYGKLPTNVSGILDYKSKMAPALFLLLDEYIHKNGILELRPLYKNIEKLGFNLIDQQQPNNLFLSTGEHSFFETSENTEVPHYSVELYAILVKASRILLKLSTEFGNIETAKKFFDFKASIDNHDTLRLFGNENFGLSNFIINNKEIKEFIGKSDSLAPFVFQLLPPASKELEHVLVKLNSPEGLWTNYGIRSENGISVAYNFMILKSLNFYSLQSSPNQDAAHALYARLRNHLIMFVAQEFKKTKTFWEFYNETNGRGLGRRDWLPSATIHKIMAELY